MSAKRASYNFKRAAIAFAEDNGNHIAAAEFGVDRACNIRWRKQRDQIFKGAAILKKFTGPCKGRHFELKEEVCESQPRSWSKGASVHIQPPDPELSWADRVCGKVIQADGAQPDPGGRTQASSKMEERGVPVSTGSREHIPEHNDELERLKRENAELRAVNQNMLKELAEIRKLLSEKKQSETINKEIPVPAPA
ncbi:hypothetical protein MTO96_031124 [Rhipicephalus appendiculatus]